jgi:hypothetical protein
MTYKNWIIEQEGAFFNLFKEEVVNKIDKVTKKPTGETEIAKKNHGWGMSLETTLRKIIYLELEKQDVKIPITKWLVEYKKLQEELRETLKVLAV